MMKRYRKKPVEVEAVLFKGSSSQIAALMSWMSGSEYVHPTVQTSDHCTMPIHTLEGVMTAKPGDYIVKGTRGEFYPVKPEPFADTFEEVLDG